MGPEAHEGLAQGISGGFDNYYRGRALAIQEDDRNYNRQRQQALDMRENEKWGMEKQKMRRKEKAYMDEQQAGKFKQATLDGIRRYKLQGDTSGLEDAYNNFFPNGKKIKINVSQGKDGKKVFQVEGGAQPTQEMSEDDFLNIVSEMYADPAKMLSHQYDMELQSTKHSDAMSLERLKQKAPKGGAQGSSEIQMIDALAASKFGGDRARAIDFMQRKELYTKFRAADIISEDSKIQQQVDAAMKNLGMGSSMPGDGGGEGQGGAGINPRDYPRTPKGFEQYLRAKHPNRTDDEYRQRIEEVWGTQKDGLQTQPAMSPDQINQRRIQGLRPREEVNAPPPDPNVQVQQDIQNSPRRQALDQSRMGERFNIDPGAGSQGRGEIYNMMARAETSIERDLRSGIIPDEDDIQFARLFAQGKGDQEKVRMYDSLMKQYYGGQ